MSTCTQHSGCGSSGPKSSGRPGRENWYRGGATSVSTLGARDQLRNPDLVALRSLRNLESLDIVSVRLDHRLRAGGPPRPEATDRSGPRRQPAARRRGGRPAEAVRLRAGPRRRVVGAHPPDAHGEPDHRRRPGPALGAGEPGIPGPGRNPRDRRGAGSPEGPVKAEIRQALRDQGHPGRHPDIGTAPSPGSRSSGRRKRRRLPRAREGDNVENPGKPYYNDTTENQERGRSADGRQINTDKTS